MDSIDRLLLDELKQAYDYANWAQFKDALVPPTLGLTDSVGRLGTWSAATRSIEISRAHARTAPWGHVIEVLHHEIAHQYVSEVLKVTDETDHGPAFKSICARMGLDPRASGIAAAVAAEEPPILRKIRKLLALADSPNRNEAEAAMNAAHRLMLQHNVAVDERRAADGYTVRHIGRARARHPAWEKALIGLLSQHFFVRVVWVENVDRATVVVDRWGRTRLRRVRVAEVLGTPENLEIADYVFAFLAQTGERLWREHKRERGLEGDADRARYLAGVITGFRRKLDEGVAQCAGEGLIWLGDHGLRDFQARRFPRLVAGSGYSLRATPEFHAGVAAGRSIVLHKPISSGPSGETRQIE